MGKSVIPGKVVQIKNEFWQNLRHDDTAEFLLEKCQQINLFSKSSSLFTVLTNPRAVVNNGHEILVVDVLASDGKILADIPIEVLETVV